MKARVFALLSASVLLTTFCAAPQLGRANEKRASLPWSVIDARTVYVDNQTNFAELLNTAYTELSKWGRLQIVDAPQKADIVIRLGNGNYVRSFPSGEYPSAFGRKAGKNNFVGADDTVPPGSTRISLIDPKTGNSLWSDIRKTNNGKAATHMLDGLRDAFDQKK